MDREKVIEETEAGIAFAESRGFGGLANTMRDALELLKEQNRKLESLVSFENGDRVIARNCPFCGSEYRIILKGPSASGAKTEE